ncbi:MAG: hypothetical protein ACXWG1_18000 [Usitatibacter sp.]
MIAFIRKHARFLGIALALGFFSFNASAQLYCANEEWGCNYYYTQQTWQSPAQFDSGTAAAAVADGFPGGLGAVELTSDGVNMLARVCIPSGGGYVSWTGWYYLGSASTLQQYVNGVLGSQLQAVNMLNSISRINRIGTYC